MKIALAWFSYGGIEKENADAIVMELQLAKARGVAMFLAHQHGDALISRSRSKLMSAVLEQTDADVFFMIDHDMVCKPGDIIDTCAAALDKQAMVSGLVSLRAHGMGFAGRPMGALGGSFELRLGTDTFIEAEYLGAGFLAVPRAVMEATLRAGANLKRPAEPSEAEGWGALDRFAAMRLTQCIYLDGSPFYDFFRPVVVPSTLHSGKFEYLSEDWAFSWRVRNLVPGSRQWLWSKPTVGHIGKQIFTMESAATARKA
jgi:hypothetical protein